jgi:bisphosphoglycerate-dependent phosphoglycerate mutase
LQQQPRYLGRKSIPLLKRYRLNERHYGAITGLSKSAVPPGVSEAELQAWRSTLDGKPPPLTSDNPFHAAIVDSCALEALMLEGLSLPLTESIRDCCARVEPLWREEIRPRVIERGQTVLVVGHANNLRALIRCVQGLDDDELSRLGVPNGLPLVYEFLSSGRPLPDPKAVGTVPPLTGRYLGLDAIRFEKIDTDRSGTLEVTELNDAGMCILEDGSCDELMQSIDNNGDGRVDFNEYVSWVKRQTNLPTSD